jgi:hypothetical protein
MALFYVAKVGVAGSNPVVRSICSTDESALRGALALFGEGEFQRSLHGGSSVEDSRALVVELAAPLSVDD